MKWFFWLKIKEIGFHLHVVHICREGGGGAGGEKDKQEKKKENKEKEITKHD